MQLLKNLIFVLVCMQSQEIMSMSSTRSKLGLNIKNLKGTHEILKDYPGYEPFWGLVFSEKDVAKNLYTFSMHQIKKEADVVVKAASAEFDPFKKSVEEYFKDKQNTATQNLVRQMFNEVGGTFNVTNADNNPVTQFKPEHLGKVLRMVHDAKNYDGALVKVIEDYLVGLKLKDPASKDFKAKDFRPFARSLAGAVQECSVQNPNALFAQNTAQGIVLGYLLWISNDSADLAQYISGFLGKSVTLPDVQYSRQDFIDILYGAPDLQDFTNVLQVMPNLQDTQEFADFVCAMVYQQKYMSPFPKKSISKTVTFGGISFHDCMDSVMLDLANIATYRQDTARLGVPPEGVTMNKVLTDFYVTCGDSSNVTHKDVNQAWTKVAQNVDGCVYNRLCDAKNFLVVATLCNGVIPVDAVDVTLPAKTVQIGSKDFVVYEKQVGDQNYWLVPKDSGLICCEMMPTRSNIIVLMNYLFNLKLYESIDAIFSPDFVQTYFAQMCSKFGWSVRGTVEKDIVVEMKDHNRFTIHLSHKAHASISFVDNSNLNIQKHQNMVDALDSKAQAVIVALDLGATLKFNPINLFYNKLQDLNDRLKVIKKSFGVSQNFAQMRDCLILSFFSLQVDNHFRDSLVKEYQANQIKTIEVMMDLNLLAGDRITQGMVQFYKTYGAQINQFLWFVISNSFHQKTIFKLANSLPQEKIMGKSLTQQIVSCIQAGLEDEHDIYSFLRLVISAVSDDVIGKLYAPQIIFWIEVGMRNQDQRVREVAFDLVEISVKKDIFDESNVEQIISFIKVMLLSEEADKAVLVIEDMKSKGFVISDAQLQEFKLLIQERIKKHYLSIYNIKKVINLGLLDISNRELIIAMIVASLNNNHNISCGICDLIKACIEKGVFDQSQATFVISIVEAWINNAQTVQDALVLAEVAVKHDILDASNLEQVSSWIRIGLRSDGSFNIYLAEKLQKLIRRKYWKISNMMAVITGKKPISKSQLVNMRVGLPADMQPLHPAQQEQPEFIPPSADQLAQQRASINDFNDSLQVAQPRDIVIYQQPQQMQLPAQQAAAVQPGMWARWKANAKNALRGGVRSVPR